jgi:hypothetical protein
MRLISNSSGYPLSPWIRSLVSALLQATRDVSDLAHARLNVTAPSTILGASLSETYGNLMVSLRNCLRLRIVNTELEGAPRDTDHSSGGLNPGAFEGSASAA